MSGRPASTAIRFGRGSGSTTSPAYLSVLSALAGALIGGLTSFLASYVMPGIQARLRRKARQARRVLRRAHDRARRPHRRYAEYNRHRLRRALQRLRLKRRIMLIASPRLMASAEENLEFIMDLYLTVAHTGAEVRSMMDDSGSDPIGRFTRACRAETRELGLG
jgi:hypothetical protein